MGRDRTQSRDRNRSGSRSVTSTSSLQSRSRVTIGFGGQNDVQVTPSKLANDGISPAMARMTNDGQPMAGVGTYKQTVQAMRQVQGGGKAQVVTHHRKDLSLLQPFQGDIEQNMQLDPGDYAVGIAAGALAKTSLLQTFMEHGHDPGAVINTNKPRNKPTDPMCLMKEAGGHPFDPQEGLWQATRKRGNYNSRSSQQNWTWVQDARVRANMGFPDLPPRAIIENKVVLNVDGSRGYNMWGEEDLLLSNAPLGSYAATIKHGYVVPQDLIVYNDKRIFPYCARDELDYHDKRPEHAHWQSDRVWDVMHDEEYAKVLKGMSPEPSQIKEFRRRARERRKQKRSSSLPPHLSSGQGDLSASPSVCVSGYSDSRSSTMSMSSPFIKNQTPGPMRASPSGKATDYATDWSHWPLPGKPIVTEHHKHAKPAVPQVNHEHGSRAPEPRLKYAPSVKPWQDSAPAKQPAPASEPARRSSAKSPSERSRGGSLCMSPLSITNARVTHSRSATARDVAPRAPTRKLARSASK